MMKELVVAEKEFKEYLMGKRFLAIFAILFILCIMGTLSGVSNYNQQLATYKAQTDLHKTDPGYLVQQQQTKQQIEEAKANNVPQDQIDMMESSMSFQDEHNMPSLINIFYGIMSPFYIVGMALSVAVGFDMISKEKEEGSLKSLLSHPIFRDSVINGKAIAAIALLAVTLGATFLVIIAILLFYGITPYGDDLSRILAFFGVSLLYCIVFLAIAIMVSTLVKNSTMSILCTLGIFLIAYSMPTISGDVSSFILGPYPQYPQGPQSIPVQPNSTVTVNGHTYTFEEANQYNQQIQAQSTLMQQEYQNSSSRYEKSRQDIYSLINIISPMSDYSDLTGVILNNYKMYDPWESMNHIWMPKKISLWESLMTRWGSLVALIVMGFACFAVSYVAFMRTDIR